MARKIPRPFSMPWGNGQVVEEAAFTSEYHEPVIQLLKYDEGGETIRFGSYTHSGSFQRSPLMIGADDLVGLREALKHAPRLRELLRQLVAD